jgi:hypothetical protein
MQAGGGGGGAGPRTIGDVVGERLLTMLEAEEEKLDQQLHQMESLEEDELERMRAQRMEVMKRNQKQKAEWLAQGHGEYREVEDQCVPSRKRLSATPRWKPAPPAAAPPHAARPPTSLTPPPLPPPPSPLLLSLRVENVFLMS